MTAPGAPHSAMSWLGVLNTHGGGERVNEGGYRIEEMEIEV